VRESVSIPLSRGGELKGVLALPDPSTPEPLPGVIVLHEIFGEQPEILRVADRFAEHGYGALAPDLFSSGIRLACLTRAMVEMSRGGQGTICRAIEDSRSWLAARPEIDEQRLAVIGFCMGGGFALAFAATAPAGVRAAAVNYGAVPPKAQSLAGSCPIVASYGGRDRIMGSGAKRLRGHLERLGIEHDVKVYEQAGHSFMTDGHHPVGRIVFLPMRIGYEPRAPRMPGGACSTSSSASSPPRAPPLPPPPEGARLPEGRRPVRARHGSGRPPGPLHSRPRKAPSDHAPVGRVISRPTQTYANCGQTVLEDGQEICDNTT
jgi:carboxymethylenebutenolidase